MRPLTLPTITMPSATIIGSPLHTAVKDDEMGGIELSRMPSSVSLRSTEEICAITHEAISDIPPHNRFLAADGKVYDKEALKQWLMVNKAAASPYMICSLLSDVPKLWPELNSKVLTSKPRTSIAMKIEKILRPPPVQVALTIGVISSASLLTLAVIDLKKQTCFWNLAASSCVNSDLIVLATTSSFIGLCALGAGAYLVSRKLAQRNLLSGTGELTTNNTPVGRQLTAEEWATVARDASNLV